MIDNQSEGVSIAWVPELAEGIDLTEAMRVIQHAMAEERFSGEMLQADEKQPQTGLPEETLIETYDSDGHLIAHAEVFNNDDGSGAIRFYGLNHSPEEQP